MRGKRKERMSNLELLKSEGCNHLKDLILDQTQKSLERGIFYYKKKKKEVEGNFSV